MKKINPKKVLTLNKVTVSMFTQTNNVSKNRVMNGSVTCLPTTSSNLV
jgi:hypothetical protein